jgi:hypothetical protein
VATTQTALNIILVDCSNAANRIKYYLMRYLYYLLFLLAVMAFLSCNKNPVENVKTTVQIYVMTSSQTAASGASVKLYEGLTDLSNNTPAATGIADANGMVTITIGIPRSSYFLIAQKGTMSNYYNGLIPIGTFQSQADIQNSPSQTPPGTIGAVKFSDTNGDGVINAADNVSPPFISVMRNANSAFSVVIY